MSFTSFLLWDLRNVIVLAFIVYFRMNVICFYFIAYFIIWKSYNEEECPDDTDCFNLNSPVEAVLICFIVSLGNFGDFWWSLNATNHSFIGKVWLLIGQKSCDMRRRFEKANNTIRLEYHLQIKSCLSCLIDNC